MTETSRPRQRLHWTPAERAQWIALFEASGQSAAEFCRENDLSPATLSCWLRQSPDDAEGELIEVDFDAVAEALSAPATPAPAVASPVAAAAAVLQLPGGARLELAEGTDPAWLARLLPVLMAPAGT